MQEVLVAAAPGGPLLRMRLLQLLSARTRGLPDLPPDSLDGPTYVDDSPPPPAAFLAAPEADALEPRLLGEDLEGTCAICVEQMRAGEAVSERPG
eukprot:2921087-Alexandrium_andersonii.AAC.1